MRHGANRPSLAGRLLAPAVCHVSAVPESAEDNAIIDKPHRLPATDRLCTTRPVWTRHQTINVNPTLDHCWTNDVWPAMIQRWVTGVWRLCLSGALTCENKSQERTDVCTMCGSQKLEIAHTLVMSARENLHWCTSSGEIGHSCLIWYNLCLKCILMMIQTQFNTW